MSQLKSILYFYMPVELYTVLPTPPRPCRLDPKILAQKSSKTRRQERLICAPQRAPKRSQNRTPNLPKSKTKIDAKKTPLQDRLGAVLERSWVILGRLLG